MSKKKTEQDVQLPVNAEKKESEEDTAKKLNTPSYDVAVDGKGNIDISPEKFLDNIDIPDEIIDTMCEALKDLREALGMAPGDTFPDGVVHDFIKTITEENFDDWFNNLDVIPDGTAPPKREVPKSLIDEETAINYPMQDDIRVQFTEDNLKELEELADGKKVFETFQIDPPDEFMDWLVMLLPILGNPLAEENHVYERIIVPYLEKIPREVLEKDEFTGSEHKGILVEGNLYIVDDFTADEYDQIMRYCGHSSEYVPNVDSFSELLEKLSKNGEFDARPDGYYEDYMEYWYEGKIYHEKDVIWINIPSSKNYFGTMKGFIANLDAYKALYEPCDITAAIGIKVENYRRVLSKEEEYRLKAEGKNLEFFTRLLTHEEVWYLAQERAKRERSAGYAIVCLKGKFRMPVYGVVNPKLPEVENLLEIFNVVPCRPNHHACCGVVIADVGNMQLCTGVRYYNGRVFDWSKRISQELAAYRKYNPDFNPYDDPYDNVEDAYYDGDD